MKIKNELKRRAGFPAVVLLLAAVLGVSCGGEQAEKFEPARVIAFGDENSLIEDVNHDNNGRKYTVNEVLYDSAVPPAPTTALNCNANPIWVQIVTAAFALPFPECNPGQPTAAPSKMLASAGAKVADVKLQVDNFLIAGNVFGSHDLVTVMAGANDIVDASLLGTPAAAIAMVEAAGTELGNQVVRITDLDAKVLISNVPNMGLTPYALADVSGARSALLSTLTSRFNAKLLTKLEDVKGGGRSAALVQADERVRLIVGPPIAVGFEDVTRQACDTPKPPQCTTSHMLLLTPASPSASAVFANGNTWLWADDRHLSPVGHAQLGSMATTRATSNPF